MLYVAAEAPESAYLRVLGWCTHHEVDPDELDGWFAVFGEPVQLGDPEHMRRVRKYVEDNGVELVVFDTRAMVTLGMDENASGDQGVAIAALKAINGHGCATLVVHHTPKDGSVGDGGRGSGAWFAAAYTSMHLKDDDKLGPILVCDKNKDGVPKCKHPLTYAKVCVPPAVMPNAREDERNTLALTHVDPLTNDPGQERELSAKELNTLLLLARNAPHKGMSSTEILPYAMTKDNSDDGYDLGSRTLVYASLSALCGEGESPHKYARVVSEKPKRYRTTDAGWDLLVERGKVTREYAEAHRRSSEDVNTPRYEAASENIAAALRELIEGGEVIGGSAQTMTQRRKLVESHLQGQEQEFSEAAWGAVYGRWKDDGCGDVTTAAQTRAGDGSDDR